MKKIGLVGGISWVSTLDYYRIINEGVNKKLRGLNSAEIVIYSLNFANIQERTWEYSYELLLDACEKLKKCDVDAIVLAANTAHLFVDRLEKEIQLPFISITTETAKSVKSKGLKVVGLLGTKFTMELGFYRNELESSGLKVLIPERDETRQYIQRVVKDELGKGEIKTESKENFIAIAKELVANGAEGIILGCTEIPQLIGEKDFSFPVFDTTEIHSQAVINYIVSD